MLVGDIIRQTAARHPAKIGIVYADKNYTCQQVKDVKGKYWKDFDRPANKLTRDP